MNKFSSQTASFLKTPTQILLNSGSLSSFTSQANMSLPTSMRRTSAAPPPSESLIQETVSVNNTSDIPMSDLLRSPTDGKPVFPMAMPTPVSEASSFAAYYTGTVSTVSGQKIIGLSVSFVASIVVFTYVQHEAKISPIPLSLSVCAFCALALRFIIPPRFLMLSHNSSSAAVGRLQVTAVFSDKQRTYRAVVLGLAQVVLVAMFAYSAGRQTMTSMHMNYFSVLPPLDFVLQKFLLRIPIKTTRRTIASAVLNFAPQVLALLAWDWVVGLEAIPIAVCQIVWIFVIYLEQASTEASAWLALIYVSFLVSVGLLIPLTIGDWIYKFYYPIEDAGSLIATTIEDLGATVACSIAIGTFFLTSGYMVKWCSSAHIVVLVSTASLILISLSDAVLTLGMKFAAFSLTAMAWAVYVK
ncbi:hypothetical protein V1512DRAFT_275584 [Lipomyces arxii]|uniref:uncharacterized protein n=1 Tax=Lipomyces arxii TaxID=56418 RepID=UPI0034CD7A6F